MAVQFPRLFAVHQEFDRPVIGEVKHAVRTEWDRVNLAKNINSNDSVAITAGSRGIANIAEITRAIVDCVTDLGAKPFIVPAMGSHGGATADGQLAVLERLCITPETSGCPIRSQMETTVLDTETLGFPIHVDRLALEADHVLLCNRVKAHTSIEGTLESGLIKMLLVGLGKQHGAELFHRALADMSFQEIATRVAPMMIDRCNVVGGFAIVENAFDETAVIQAIHPSELISKEQELLLQAKRLMPRIPVDDLDVLLIDEIGKDISGTGMDTNVIGRKSNDHQAIGEETPRVKRICIRSLTAKTAGNATGIGIAEYCHTRILGQIDRHVTNTNCLTANHPTGAMLPIDFPTDQAMLEAAFSTIGLRSPTAARFAWIKNTRDLANLVCSMPLLDEVLANSALRVTERDLGFQFDEAGDLRPLNSW